MGTRRKPLSNAYVSTDEISGPDAHRLSLKTAPPKFSLGDIAAVFEEFGGNYQQRLARATRFAARQRVTLAIGNMMSVPTENERHICECPKME
jgi:hypothetical protein